MMASSPIPLDAFKSCFCFPHRSCMCFVFCAQKTVCIIALSLKPIMKSKMPPDISLPPIQRLQNKCICFSLVPSRSNSRFYWSQTFQCYSLKPSLTKVIYKPTSEVKHMWITSAADGPSTSHTLGFIYIYIYFFFFSLQHFFSRLNFLPNKVKLLSLFPFTTCITYHVTK